MSSQTPAKKPIKIKDMQEEHIESSCDLWINEYKKNQKGFKMLPSVWVTDCSLIQSFLKNHVKNGDGIVATICDEVVGYMVYDKFIFHGQKIVYCPITGHSSVKPEQGKIYHSMYKELSGLWVENGILDHYITVFQSSDVLKSLFFQLGFGLYTVDAYRLTEPVNSDSKVSIMKASTSNIDELLKLTNELHEYMKSPPIFLESEKQNGKYYKDFINNEDSAVFIAEFNGEIVGVMSIRRSPINDFSTLSCRDTGQIDEIGAYIKKTCRGQGIGTALLKKVVEWCKEHDIARIYVDYESANQYASKFWSKYFTPVMYSLKRRIHPDILEK